MPTLVFSPISDNYAYTPMLMWTLVYISMSVYVRSVCIVHVGLLSDMG